MKATQRLHDAGQSIWLDNITRAMVNSGTLARYVNELSVTGLTSNPTIFDHAIRNGRDYDPAIRTLATAGKTGEELFFELALEDLRQAADLFRRAHDLTNRVDGWVSLERRHARSRHIRTAGTCRSRRPRDGSGRPATPPRERSRCGARA